jgi:DNA-binding response OmpR family regulator
VELVRGANLKCWVEEKAHHALVCTVIVSRLRPQRAYDVRRIATVLSQPVECIGSAVVVHLKFPTMATETLILIVDDDAELASMLVELLAREGWATYTVLNARDAERALATQQPDLVLLDAMLPDGNGFDLARRWRMQHPSLGLVMLTARGDPMDRVLGLEIGADDYLSKPFEPRELVARVRALLRRTAPGRGNGAVLRFSGLSIDILQREVTAAAGVVALTSIEFKLLVALAKQPGTPMAREALSEAVQAGGYQPQERTVDVQIARLRRKLHDASPGAEWIETVRGEGYVFVPRGGGATER